eukprot:7382431-Prymnesium_polylepis.2
MDDLDDLLDSLDATYHRIEERCSQAGHSPQASTSTTAQLQDAASDKSTESGRLSSMRLSMRLSALFVTEAPPDPAASTAAAAVWGAIKHYPELSLPGSR